MAFWFLFGGVFICLVGYLIDWAERTPDHDVVGSDSAAAEGDLPTLSGLPAIHAFLRRHVES